MSPPTPPTQRRWFWEKFTPDDRQAGADLAALRRGLGRTAGAVPEMWRYYTTLNREGELRPELVAEHVALSLFGLHQQSQSARMHRPGIGVGDAGLALRNSEKYSSEAVDRRITMVATATSPTELIGHLRGLITLLSNAGQPLDYTRLHQDVRGWHYPESRDRIRQRWGGQYHNRHKRQEGASSDSAA
ncbi:hypothetical protein GCM10009799_41420 [Nocardiopsis rhodophaea]|uniref:Type I-E CRISPR-associated protein Cse2/CasB n=1 Tax=Nocardiopsis rhodophaea TaxID=280238 RepID=A0ABP5EY91_9ACTN